jgi:hypothetical protein
MKFFIHYNPATGEILGWGNSFDVTPIESMAVAYFNEPVHPDPATQAIDPDTGELVDKTPEAARAARMPTVRDVQVAIYRELVRTDVFVLPDYPIDNGAHDAWKEYRQMLRDLSKHFRDATGMIEACDTAPDGADPMNALRARL